MLPEWDATEAPLRMGDWLTVLGPMNADLSASAEDWWTLMLKEVGDWYQHHLSLSLLDRTSHLPETPAVLQDRRWRRLERRVAGLLLKAIPESQREDLIAQKYMTVFGILTLLQISYQPGGFGEKRTLLKNLEEPAEATNSNDAVISLRKWGTVHLHITSSASACRASSEVRLPIVSTVRHTTIHRASASVSRVRFSSL